MSEVVVIDNGGANIASVLFALERLGATASVSRDPALIARAPRLILPGVGAARAAMQRLRELRLERLIPGLTQPLLGICLGMQLLFEGSAEGDTECLGVIPGRAEQLRAAAGRPVPHMGWNTLTPGPSPLLEGLGTDAWAYFVHSYALPPGATTIAECDYGGKFSAAVSCRNFHGVQFHPERSAATGARLLSNFLALGSSACS